MKFTGAIKSKIFAKDEIAEQIRLWRGNGQKIVFTNGCFDIIHLGHVNYLAEAASLGDKLVIGLNTDNSVRKIKGENRPINNEVSRSSILASFFFVDGVVFFDEETPFNIISTVQPDILAKGSDYKAEDIVGYDIVTARGGKVITINLTRGQSTSGLISKIVAAYSG